MKKYVFAGDWVLGKMVGVHRFAYQILIALDAMLDDITTDIRVTLLVPKNSTLIYTFKNIQIVKRGYIRNKVEKHFWQQIIFPAYVRTHGSRGVDLALALPVWGCDICTIHDCIMEAYPDGFQDHKVFRKIYMFKVKISARRRKRKILTVSNNAKLEIQKYYKIDDDRISVIGNGWEHMTGVEPDMSVFNKNPNIKRDDYFFSLGSKYKHKNFEWIIKTAKRNPQYQFIVSGDDNYSSHSNSLHQEKIDNLIYTGYLNDGEIKALMTNCKAFIQPSLYEGFGIPPLEALSCGAKIIVSNVSCLPEIYMDSAYYINPYSDGCDLDELLSNECGVPDKVLLQHSWKKCTYRLLQIMNI